MRENRTSGSEGGEAQTNELSLPLSLRHPLTFPVYEDPPWSDHIVSPWCDIPSVGGPSVVRTGSRHGGHSHSLPDRPLRIRSDRRTEAAPTLRPSVESPNTCYNGYR